MSELVASKLRKKKAPDNTEELYQLLWDKGQRGVCSVNGCGHFGVLTFTFMGKPYYYCRAHFRYIRRELRF